MLLEDIKAQILVSILANPSPGPRLCRYGDY